MRYCTRCQRIEEKEIERCSICHKQLKRNIEENDPVFLLETSILESERIEAALEDEGIPYASRTPKKEPSATIITGNKNASVYLYVPFQVWEKAKDLMIGIGAVSYTHLFHWEKRPGIVFGKTYRDRGRNGRTDYQPPDLRGNRRGRLYGNEQHTDQGCGFYQPYHKSKA